ncbi:MAG: serine/threonine protein kinase [Planctomycetes bacterium]|nr:serine/threonine protein kinase [Planctomycetota bacterium]
MTPPQQVFGPYQVLRKIRDGGSSTVYRALDIRDGRAEVAVKVWRGDAADSGRAVEGFRREANLLRTLQHACIIRLIHTGLDASPPYFAMEYFEGRNLKELILSRSPLVQRPQGIEILARVARTLLHLHSLGIVHRDLKPENILVDARGDLRLIDFALAAEEPAGWRKLLPRSRRIEGSRPYMSPEQIRGDPPDRRTDIYALGTVLYELLAGRTPFEGAAPDEILHKHLQEPPPPLPASSGDERFRSVAWTIIQRCMEKAPERRFPSMDEVATILDRLAAASAQPAPGAGKGAVS